MSARKNYTQLSQKKKKQIVINNIAKRKVCEDNTYIPVDYDHITDSFIEIR